MTVYTNTPYDRLTVGMEAEATRLCVADDLYVFAHASGNMNPLHLPKEDGDLDGKPEAIAPSAWLAALISGVLGSRLPGPGTLYKSQALRFLGRAEAGDTVTAKVRLTALGDGREATFDTWIEAEDGTRLAEGEAVVIAPEKSQDFKARDVPGLTVQSHVHFDRLIAEAEHLDPIPTAVVAPESADSLAGAVLGWKHTLITPILVGSAAKIANAAIEAGVSIEGLELIDEPDHARAAARAVALVHEGRAQAVMKGHLHTDTLLRAVIKREGGLRTGRRLSHVFVMDVPGVDHLVLVTDAAINIAPDLETKVDIVQNAIDLGRALGIEQPKVGVLSAVETVTPNIPSTLDAAVLSKMAERGQIKGGIVDGPLAMDNAVDLEAAATKGIKSLVAGRADILVAPNLEAGNMIAKQLTFVAHAEAGGIVIGASVPVILSSRADDDKARLASCAVAALYAARRPMP
ncbi:bifunctional enoyl-CoA hydratase/phosphate acetyltransferase [Pelagovum pacificum]|uniref:Bifunctional enoyl-CoA hydratase/phosphate acetyltransferase n=1 Tax=Pelagovum pacificum TaxID=2588711 RepID=A0A5C5GFC2_9RHOB|nr:bifunctional enoyl-CoA hydratase/phosphate acetyltransferase [Pelagovum pacificum]QQA43414.1 bifunctional enoyl-CoA hydratase/phosphate acetyltransferase [Pelagovum pacificum]TNY33448.1 bifunctional enoyl-CoA hydratase/phosphate acetyltransferase [Pelagovum pacificum]